MEEQIKIPTAASNFGPYEANPQLIIDLLKDSGGDLTIFISHFKTHSKSNEETVIARSLGILNQSGNEQLLSEWNALIDAFCEAKWRMQQNKAMRFISEFDPPKKMAVPAFVQFAKMWQPQAHIETEKARAKQTATDTVNKPKPQPTEHKAATSTILTAMQDDESED